MGCPTGDSALQALPEGVGDLRVSAVHHLVAEEGEGVHCRVGAEAEVVLNHQVGEGVEEGEVHHCPVGVAVEEEVHHCQVAVVEEEEVVDLLHLVGVEEAGVGVLQPQHYVS